MTDIEDFHKFINNPSHIRTRDDFLNYDIKYPNIYNFLEDSIINIISLSVQMYTVRSQYLV